MAVPRRGGARRAPRRARRGVVRGRGRGRGVGQPRDWCGCGDGSRSITSAGEVLGTGGDPRHDVIDMLATVGPDDARPTARRCSSNLRAHRRVDLVDRGARPGRARHAARARRARGHRRGRRAHPARPRSRRTRRWSWSTRRATPFATAWNETLSRTARRSSPPSAHAMVRRARFVAPLALAALSVVAALSLGRVVDSSRFVLPVVGAALLPHALGALVRWRGWPVWVGAALAVVGARGLRGARARAVDHHHRTPGLRHVAHDRDPALGRLAPAAHRAGARARHRRRHPARGARGVGDGHASPTGSRSGATPRSPRISPALVFFVWTSTLGTDDTQVLLTVGFCVAAGAFVLAQNLALLDQRRSWLVSQRGARPHWLAPGGVARGRRDRRGARGRAARARRRRRPAARRRRHGPQRLRRAQLQAARSRRSSTSARKLGNVDDVELFTVQSTQARLLAHRRARQLLERRRRSVDAERARATAACRSGLPSSACRATRSEQHFAIGPLGERWLPAAYRAGRHRPGRHARGRARRARSSPTPTRSATSTTRWSRSCLRSPATRSPTRRRRPPTRRCPPPAALRRSPRFPRHRRDQEHRHQRRDRGGSDDAVREGGGVARLVPRGQRLPVYDTTVGTTDNAPAILAFLQQPAWVLRAVRQRVRGDGAVAGHPGPGRGGLHPGHSARPATRTASPATTPTRGPRSTSQAWGGRTSSIRRPATRRPAGSNLPKDDAAPTQTQPTVPPPTVTTPTPGSTTPGATGNPATPGTTPATPTLAPVTASSSSSTGAWLPVLVVLALARAARRRLRRRGARAEAAPTRATSCCR